MDQTSSDVSIDYCIFECIISCFDNELHKLVLVASIRENNKFHRVLKY